MAATNKVLFLAALFSLGGLQAAPWIQADRWMVLGPIETETRCHDPPNGGDLEPIPGHDFRGECPLPGEKWAGEIRYSPRALEEWTPLADLGFGPSDAVDLNSFAAALDLRDSRVKVAAVTYAINHTGGPIDVDLCWGSADLIQVWFNDRLPASVRACNLWTPCGCNGTHPVALVPGTNKIAVVVWARPGIDWNYHLRLLRPDGSVIDDSTDPEVEFTVAPSGGCPEPHPFELSRSFEGINACRLPGGETLVRIEGNGEGDPEDSLTISEAILGNAVPSSISNGGTFIPGAPRDRCNKEAPSHPVGLFTDYGDIGVPCATGNTAESAPGLFQVTGAGGFAFDCEEQFQFASLPLRGDFQLTAHIAKRDWGGPAPPSRWGRFGLMAREDCSRRSRFAFMYDTTPNQDPPVTIASYPGGPDPDSVGFFGRSIEGGEGFIVADRLLPSGVHPDFLRLERVGSRFVGSSSADGRTWIENQEMDWGVDAPCKVLVGLAVNSWVSCAPITIHFDQVEVSGGDHPCAPVPEAEGGRIVWNLKLSGLNSGLSYRLKGQGRVKLSGNDGHHAILGENRIELRAPEPIGPHFDGSIDLGGVTTGSTSYEAEKDVYTQKGSGLGIWQVGDYAQFAYREVRGDFDLEVQVLERKDPEGGRWGKHGLMARRDCGYSSKYTLLSEYIGSGEVEELPAAVSDLPGFQSRAVHGVNRGINFTYFDYPPVQLRPDFMRLIRRGNTFYGFLSADGQRWDSLGAETWPDQDPDEAILAGFTTHSIETHREPPVVKFKVLRFGGIDPALPRPLHDDGVEAGRVIYTASFDDLTDFKPKASGAFVPSIVERRLRMQDEETFPSSTSAFREAPLVSVDARIYQFDFDVFLARKGGEPPGDGLTFALIGGSDAGWVGGDGAFLGYESPGRPASFNALSVEFDTYQSLRNLFGSPVTNEGKGSPTYPRKWHLAINPTNTVDSVVETSEDLPDIFDPKGIHARVRYNRGRVSVWLAPQAGSLEGLKKHLEADVLPISWNATDGSAVFGFTASTGWASETGEVDNLRVAEIDCDDIPEAAVISGVPAEPVAPGTVVTLDGSASSAGPGDDTSTISTYRWEIESGPGAIQGASDGPTVTIEAAAAGSIAVHLTVDDGDCANPASAEATVLVAGAVPNWLRCDANGDRRHSISDPILLLRSLFQSGAAPECAAASDCNSDGARDVSDAVFDLTFQFLGGPPPAAPYPECEAFAACAANCVSP